MKKCNRCNIEKEESEYYKNSKRIYPYCKACAKTAYAEKHYQNNKEKYYKSSALRGKNKRLEWVEFKSQFKCQECDESRHWVLDFHHIDSSSKEGLVSKLFYDGSKERFLNELNKCITLCRNCHADLHYKERIGQGKR